MIFVCYVFCRQFESELADFEDEFQDFGLEDGRSSKRAEGLRLFLKMLKERVDCHICQLNSGRKFYPFFSDITISPETPPEYYLHVSSTDSSPKGASLSGRKRLSDLFRYVLKLVQAKWTLCTLKIENGN
jgi:hypothetical protein